MDFGLVIADCGFFNPKSEVRNPKLSKAKARFELASFCLQDRRSGAVKLLRHILTKKIKVNK